MDFLLDHLGFREVIKYRTGCPKICIICGTLKQIQYIFGVNFWTLSKMETLLPWIAGGQIIVSDAKGGANPGRQGLRNVTPPPPSLLSVR